MDKLAIICHIMGLFDGLLGKKSDAPHAPVNPPAVDLHAPISSVGDSAAVVRVTDVYQIAGVGCVPVGTVQSGVLKVGARGTVNGKVAIVKSIEAQHQSLPSAMPGQAIGFCLGGVVKADIQKNTDYSFGI